MADSRQLATCCTRREPGFVPRLRHLKVRWPVELVESGEGGVEIDELIHREEWFPVSLAPDRAYEVSHIDSPVMERVLASPSCSAWSPAPTQ